MLTIIVLAALRSALSVLCAIRPVMYGLSVIQVGRRRSSCGPRKCGDDIKQPEKDSKQQMTLHGRLHAQLDDEDIKETHASTESQTFHSCKVYMPPYWERA